MKKTYHLCLSAGNEILFRSQSDYDKGFNIFALALSKSDSVGLVEAFMATHCHLLVQTSDPNGLMHCFRNSYSKYFNNKYLRAGKLGEDKHFALDVVGYHHRIAAASYVLRNPLHHGVVSIPYAYKNSSVNAIFRAEMGKFSTERNIDRRHHSKYIGRYNSYPDSYKMNEKGLFIRESVLDIPQVEEMYVSPRMFNFYMSRRSGEEWEKEQVKDNNAVAPISLESIEKFVDINNLNQMLLYEQGRADYKKISDIELCEKIDGEISERYGKKTIYELSASEKIEFANYLHGNYRLGAQQLKRCLAMKV